MFSRIKKSFITMLAVATLLPLITIPMSPKAEAAGNVTVNLAAEKQRIQGFGGMNHSVWIGDLTPAQRETAFGNGANQLGFSILRIPIHENKSNWQLEVATAKAAIAKGAIVFASPWNPPSDMVENFNKNGQTAKRLKYDKYAAYAQYLNEFDTYMKNNGVNLYAISVQNEPDYAHEWTWWTPNEILRFMKENAGSINNRVIAPESFQYRKDISDPILNDPQALQNMDILGAHTYGTQFKDFAYPLFKQKAQGKGLWMTEVYYPNSDMDSGNRWPEALDISYHMHHAMVEADFEAYVWWYIRRGYGPMSEDGTISKRGYNMAHFSKFVRPGYKRVDATKTPENNVFVSAYKGDNKVVIVAINRNAWATSENITLQNGSASTVSSWVTDASRNLAANANINVTNNGFTAQLPAQSVTTFVADLGASTGNPGNPETPGNTGTTYEAEKDTTLVNAIAEKTNEPNPTGFVNFIGVTDASIQWDNIYCAISGTKNIRFRYALETGTRYLDVYVNGTKVINNAPFTATGAWGTWGETTIQVPMNEGLNSLKVVTTGTEGPNIDNIHVTASN